MSIESTVTEGVRAAWELSNGKNDELAQRVFKGREGALSNEQYKRYFNNNAEALTDICDTLAGRYPKDFKFTG